MKNKFILLLSCLVLFTIAGKAQTIGPITGYTVVCVGSTMTVSDTTLGGTWSISPTGIASVSATGVVTGIAAGTGHVNYVVGTGTVSASLTVATSTVTAGSITGSSTVCPMTAITLTDPTGTSGGTWSSSVAVIASVSATPGVVEGVSAGTVNISYVVSSSCGLFSTSVPLTVYPLPVIGTISATTTDVCIGSNISFLVAPLGGTWHASNPLVGTVSGGVVTGVSAGIDSIFYTLSTPCGSVDTYFVVTVLGLPSAGVITGSTGVCTGAMITLSDTTSGGAWSAYNSNATVASGVVTGVYAGTDSIYYSVTNMCGTTDTFLVMSITSSTVTGGAIVGGGVVSASYTIALTDPTGTTGGTWSSSAPGVASVSPSGIVRGLSPGTANISYGLATSCGLFSAYQPVIVYPYPVIPLQLYYDANTDCAFDSGDTYMSVPVTIGVDSNGVPMDTITATAGLNYTVYGRPGDVYGFHVISAPYGLFAACPSGTVYDTLNSADAANTLQIGFRCTSASSYDFAVNPFVFFTGRYDQMAHVYLSNTTCYSPGSTLVISYSHKCVFDPSLSGGNTYPTQTSYTDSTITWDFSGPLGTDPTPIGVHYQIWYNPSIGPLAIGDTIHTTYTIYPISGDLDTANNTSTLIDTVKAGCDPNEMLVNPICMPNGDTSRTLTYTIGFMNTGNDTAYNIYILDTLPSNLDPMSLSIIMSSNKMFVTKYHDTIGQTIFRFDYPGINLLDSSYHDLCDGGLVFSINTLPGLATGTVIANRAGIYFDNNAVVMTNTVITQDGGCIPTSVAPSPSKGALNLYPNPTAQTLMIEADAQAYNTAIISNVLGNEVMTIPLSGTRTSVDVSELPQGVYFVNVGTGSGREVKMFVKM